MLPIEQTCYWMTSTAYEYEPPFQGHHQTETAIIGAGFTGLWTAIFLKEMAPDLAITILEQGMAGYGGSGRNAGILDVTVDHSHSLAIAHFGFDEAKKLAKLGLQNVQEMTAFIESQQIDCELEKTGRLLVALTPAQADDAKESVKIAEDLGIEGYQWLARDGIQNEIRSPIYLGGVYIPGAAVLNPFKLVQGLKRYLKMRGVQFHEQTRVNHLSSEGIKTDRGSLTAKKIIVATDAFTHHLLPRLISRYIPLYDYILVSDPLTQEQHDAIGWRRRQGVTDGRTFFNYYRLTKDNRILFGTSEAMYYPPNLVNAGCDHSESHYRALEESFVRHFPQLADLQFPYAWGGAIASTTRLTPFFGSLDEGRILYALGYTGHGLGTTRIAGKILSHMALSRPSELLKLKMVRQKPFPYPPEPIRSMAIKSVTKSLRKTDLGERPGILLKILDLLGIGFSS
jgi:glycine/D-amino acid oxidase-like deaminating enzyme